MEGLYDAQKLWWASYFGQNLKETFSADQVKSLGEVDEGNIQRHILLSALFLKLPDGEDHVYCGSLGPETTL